MARTSCPAGLLHQDRHLPEHLAATEPPGLAGGLQLHRAGGDEVHARHDAVLADDRLTGVGIPGSESAAEALQHAIVDIGEERGIAGTSSVL